MEVESAGVTAQLFYVRIEVFAREFSASQCGEC